MHILYNKHNDSHQDYLRGLSENENSNFGFLYNAYTFCFPYTIFLKRNIPTIVPEEFEDNYFNPNILVNNYIDFDSNINSEKASAFIRYNVKNKKGELSTLHRRKIVDDFDRIFLKTGTVFNNIGKEINIVLDAVTNIQDTFFNDIVDINNFIDQNKFIIDLISRLVTLYADIFVKQFIVIKCQFHCPGQLLTVATAKHL